jgi:hypothetical protein
VNEALAVKVEPRLTNHMMCLHAYSTMIISTYTVYQYPQTIDYTHGF